MTVEESMHVVFDETNPKLQDYVPKIADEEETTLEKKYVQNWNTSAINLTKNPIQHSKTKNIEIRHHFIRDHIQKGDIEIMFVKTENQLANLFTKPLTHNRFKV